MNIQGLHHITLVAEDAQRTVDFYTQTLGLRLIKTTVNFDDPGSYHLYFGDAHGSPGSVITFFIVPGARRGSSGMGGTHHYALSVKDGAALRKWKRWLTDRGVRVNGPLDRHYFESLYFRDPDGTIIELATEGPGFTVDEEAGSVGTEYRAPPEEMVRKNRDQAAIDADTHPEPVTEITTDMALTRGMHHISAVASNIEKTNSFYVDVLGMKLMKRTSNFDDPSSPHWYWTADSTGTGGGITYFQMDPQRTPPARMGAGQTHHFAFTVPDEEAQLHFARKLTDAGHRVSPVMNRDYFKSIYSADPDGHIVEIATAGPGFAVDEPEDQLGMNLQLPDQLKPHREQIIARLPKFTVPVWKGG